MHVVLESYFRAREYLDRIFCSIDTPVLTMLSVHSRHTVDPLMIKDLHVGGGDDDDKDLRVNHDLAAGSSCVFTLQQNDDCLFATQSRSHRHTIQC